MEVLVGAALDTLPTLSGPFDLVFIDADKSNNPAYLEWALRLGRAGTVIVVDNVVRRIGEDGPDGTAPGCAGDARSRSAPGCHRDPDRRDQGWDGFALARIRA